MSETTNIWDILSTIDSIPRRYMHLRCRFIEAEDDAVLHANASVMPFPLKFQIGSDRLVKLFDRAQEVHLRINERECKQMQINESK